MRAFLTAALMISASAAPALAAKYFVLGDLENGKCEVTMQQPDASNAAAGATLKTLGAYDDEAAATAAMAKMQECNK